MILDKLLELDPANTAVTVTRDSTNVIDLVNPRDLGPTESLWLTVQTGPSNWAGGTNLTVSLQGSVDNSTYIVLAQSGTILTAALLANTVIWSIDIPRRAPQFLGTFPRYLKLVYTVTGTYSTGGIGAWFNLDPQMAFQYPPGIAIQN